MANLERVSGRGREEQAESLLQGDAMPGEFVIGGESSCFTKGRHTTTEMLITHHTISWALRPNQDQANKCGTEECQRIVTAHDVM